MMPLSIIFPHPLPDRAAVLPAKGMQFEARVDYSSIFIDDAKGSESILVDGEFMRTALALRLGLGGGTEVGVEIPFLHYTSGFLDSFIESWHGFFGLSQGQRDQYPKNQFGVDYSNASGTFFSAEEDGLHLGDIPLTLKVGVLDPAADSIGLALRGLLELPTGNESDGFGSGKLDGGLGVVVEKRFEDLAFYFSMDHVFRKNPDSFDGIHTSHVTHGSLAAEFRVSNRISLILQTDYQTKPLSNATLAEFTDPQWMAGLGAAFRVGKGSFFRIAFEEGITTESAPDFTVSAGYTVTF